MNRLLLAATTATILATTALAQEESRFIFRAKAGAITSTSALPIAPEVPADDEEEEASGSGVRFELTYFDVTKDIGNAIGIGDRVLAEVAITNDSDTPMASAGLMFHAGFWPFEASGSCGHIGAWASGTCTLSHTITADDVCWASVQVPDSDTLPFEYEAYLSAMQGAGWLPSDPDVGYDRADLIRLSDCSSHNPAFDIASLDISLDSFEHVDIDGNGRVSVGDQFVGEILVANNSDFHLSNVDGLRFHVGAGTWDREFGAFRATGACPGIGPRSSDRCILRTTVTAESLAPLCTAAWGGGPVNRTDIFVHWAAELGGALNEDWSDDGTPFLIDSSICEGATNASLPQNLEKEP